MCASPLSGEQVPPSATETNWQFFVDLVLSAYFFCSWRVWFWTIDSSLAFSCEECVGCDSQAELSFKWKFLWPATQIVHKIFQITQNNLVYIFTKYPHSITNPSIVLFTFFRNSQVIETVPLYPKETRIFAGLTSSCWNKVLGVKFLAQCVNGASRSKKWRYY
jgi:hypothetical protein